MLLFHFCCFHPETILDMRQMRRQQSCFCFLHFSWFCSTCFAFISLLLLSFHYVCLCFTFFPIVFRFFCFCFTFLAFSPGGHVGHKADARPIVLLSLLSLRLIFFHFFCFCFTPLAFVSLCLPRFTMFALVSLFFARFFCFCFTFVAFTWRPCWRWGRCADSPGGWRCRRGAWRPVGAQSTFSGPSLAPAPPAPETKSKPKWNENKKNETRASKMKRKHKKWNESKTIQMEAKQIKWKRKD